MGTRAVRPPRLGMTTAALRRPLLGGPATAWALTVPGERKKFCRRPGRRDRGSSSPGEGNEEFNDGEMMVE